MTDFLCSPLRVLTPTALQTVAQGKLERAERVPVPPWDHHAKPIATSEKSSNPAIIAESQSNQCRIEFQHICAARYLSPGAEDGWAEDGWHELPFPTKRYGGNTSIESNLANGSSSHAMLMTLNS